MLAHLGPGDAFREALSFSPMGTNVGDDLTLGWDWISSRNLRLLCVDGRVSLRSGPAQLQLDLLPAGARLAPRTLSVIGHGEPCLLFRQIELVVPEPAVPAPLPPPPQAPPRRSTGLPRPLHAHHADLALQSAHRQAARALRRPGLSRRSPAVPAVDGVKVLKVGPKGRNRSDV